ncbi:hypothetical protein PR048_022060 [Dryococelus australis]|uniref:Uncharacterized protein n=1 Tax=Dryococelus australis TaxID=614101 RepID=A0ABQ9GZY8_9NEOP|nr:hypothetical protein PR048_022060 [Dryococelus australis]
MNSCPPPFPRTIMFQRFECIFLSTDGAATRTLASRQGEPGAISGPLPDFRARWNRAGRRRWSERRSRPTYVARGSPLAVCERALRYREGKNTEVHLQLTPWTLQFAHASKLVSLDSVCSRDSTGQCGRNLRFNRCAWTGDILNVSAPEPRPCQPGKYHAIKLRRCFINTRREHQPPCDGRCGVARLRTECGPGEGRCGPVASARVFARRRRDRRACGNSCVSRPGAVVAERLDSSHPTKANRFQSPTGSLSDFRKWESNQAMPLVGRVFSGSPISPPLYSSVAPYPPRFTFIGSQDLAVKSRPNFFTHCILFVPSRTINCFSKWRHIYLKYARMIHLRLLAYFACNSGSTCDVTSEGRCAHKYVVQASSEHSLRAHLRTYQSGLMDGEVVWFCESGSPTSAFSTVAPKILFFNLLEPVSPSLPWTYFALISAAFCGIFVSACLAILQLQRGHNTFVYVAYRYNCGEGRDLALRADEGEVRRVRGGGKIGDPRENPPTSGIVRNGFHVRKSGSDPACNRTRLA